MADATVSERPNKVTIKDAGPCLKKVLIEIPAETVADQLGSSLDTLMVEAELPGFRKGHAPRRLIEKRFGTVVRKEAKEQLVAQAYSKAIEEHKLRVIGDPASEMLAKIEVEDGKPLAFEVEVEVPPSFTVPSTDGIEVKRPVTEVADSMIDEQLERIALQEGRLESQESAAAGDYLTGHGKVIGSDDKTYIDINDAVIQIPTPDKEGKGMILGIKVDDFAAQLGVPAVGDKVTIKTTGPEGHEIEAIRGMDLTVEFYVSRADRIIPASMEDLTARFGFADTAGFREAIRQRIQERIAVEQAAAMREQVARHLVESVEMELPERLTQNQTERNLSRKRLELSYRGVDALKIEEDIADLRAASNESTVRELKLFFILDRIGEEMDIKVTEGEINSRIVQMAVSSNERPEKLRAELIQRNQIGALFQQIREHKTLDAILAKAKVTDVPAEEYNKDAIDQSKKRSESRAAAKKSKPKAEKAEEKDDDAKAEKKPAKKPAKKSDK
ncbi:MAG: trigger factor [Phycisphaeraceae bacterium]|nr:trigger factor [Phycisphaeraceae bacterium]